MQALPKNAVRYMWLLSLVGMAAAAQTLLSMPDGAFRWPEVAFFALLIAIAEFFPVCLPGSGAHTAVSFPISYAILLTLGTGQAEVALLSGFLAANLILRGNRIKELYLFFLLNMGNLGLSIFSAGVVYHLMGGGTTSLAPATAPASEALRPLAVIGGATAYCVANTSMCIIASGLLERQRLSVIVANNMRMMWPGYVFLTPFAALIAMLYSQVGMWTVVPFFIPFMAARQCLNLYSRRMQTYMDTVAMLGTLTMRYHPYTREHLEAVAIWSERIAGKMHLSAKKTMAIRLAGVLHDVGKVGVGEVILDKTGKLSEEDWLLIKGHPVKGANILGKLRYFDEIVPWVLHHHERMDGRGYPSGLQGEEIPFEARIIAVADSFHAMMSKERSYRVPMSIEEAKEELQKGSGTQFDPEVVTAMIAVLEA